MSHELHDDDQWTWLTIAELHQRLGMPANTLRSWTDAYAAYVPQRFDERRIKLFPLERLVEIAATRATMGTQVTHREVNAELARRYGGEPPPGGAVPLGLVVEMYEQLRAELAEVRAILEQLRAESARAHPHREGPPDVD